MLRPAIMITPAYALRRQACRDMRGQVASHRRYADVGVTACRLHSPPVTAVRPESCDATIPPPALHILPRRHTRHTARHAAIEA